MHALCMHGGGVDSACRATSNTAAAADHLFYDHLQSCWYDVMLSLDYHICPTAQKGEVAIYHQLKLNNVMWLLFVIIFVKQ